MSGFFFSCFSTRRDLAMKCRIASLFAVSAFLAVLLQGSAALNAHAADSAPTTLASIKTEKYKCLNVCRARYRDCVSLKQIPSFECKGVYKDCVHDSCDAVRG
jgi:hypothetical protein